MLTPEERDHLLTREANYNMRIARKQGMVIIVQTLRGNVELTYHRHAKTYRLTQLGSLYPTYREPAPIIDNATAAQAREELKKLFEIEEE